MSIRNGAGWPPITTEHRGYRVRPDKTGMRQGRNPLSGNHLCGPGRCHAIGLKQQVAQLCCRRLRVGNIKLPDSQRHFCTAVIQDSIGVVQ